MMTSYEEADLRRLPRKELTVMMLQELFAVEQRWYVLIFGYTVTHRMLNFVIHKEKWYPGRYYDVLCAGTQFFAGPTDGGPFQLQVAPIQFTYPDVEPLPGIEISNVGNAGHLIVRCSQISNVKYVNRVKDGSYDLPPEVAERIRLIRKALDAHSASLGSDSAPT